MLLHQHQNHIQTQHSLPTLPSLVGGGNTTQPHRGNQYVTLQNYQRINHLPPTQGQAVGQHPIRQGLLPRTTGVLRHIPIQDDRGLQLIPTQEPTQPQGFRPIHSLPSQHR